MPKHYTLGFNSLRPGYIVWCWPFWSHILNPLTYWRWLKRFCQRGFYGYAENDYWDGDSYLEEVMLGVITDLKKHTHSYPNSLADYKMGEDVEEDCPADTGFDKWQAVLSEITEGLEASRELIDEKTVPEGVYSDGPWHFEELEGEPRLSKMVDESNHTFDHERYKEWQKPLLAKRKRAMLLLVKHWGSFWD